MIKKLILVTNDDGVNSKGISALIEIACELGDVIVVAPDGPRSAQSNSLTVETPIYHQLLRKEEGLTVYQCSGTPTDCIKLAMNSLLTRKPDLLLSGINHGSNSSISVIYSGTMGAVLEGCEQEIQSIGFSLCCHHKNADFSETIPFFTKIARKVMQEPLPYGVCLNVNAPQGSIKGIKICQQAKGVWKEEFDAREKPNGQVYFWLTGAFVNHEPDNRQTDEWALANGYISVVPTQIDLTHYPTIDVLRKQDYESF